MIPTAFLDANILLRHFLSDHEEHSPSASRLIARIESGAVTVRISESVIFETVFTMSKTYAVPRVVTSGLVLPFIDQPHVVLPGKAIFHDVFPLWANTQRLSFPDSYHVVYAKRYGLTQFLSFDQGIRSIEGISRVEPDDI
ncbi:MAG: type II toxin-antitoxin system VapC family toxin [Thermomicrobiales bacterium]|nr:type II toxin-antitoxin system VapC family toxin [Thermomicrobiales bacterium]